MKLIRNILFASACVAAAGLLAVASPAGPQTKTTKHATKTEKSASSQAGKKLSETGVLGKEEKISGTLFLVDASQDQIFVKGSDNTPYAFKITKRTKIEMNNQKVALADLSQQVQKPVTITFVPKSEGNFAQHVQVNEG
jgi:hypothetical protein